MTKDAEYAWVFFFDDEKIVMMLRWHIYISCYIYIYVYVYVLHLYVQHLNLNIQM